MPDPALIPSIAALGGGVWAARDYLRRRLDGPDDRYMALYGRDAWDASNMDLDLSYDPSDHGRVVDAFRARVARRLASSEPTLLREALDLGAGGLTFTPQDVEWSDLVEPRHGVWFDVTQPGRVRVVWNHMQVDGVGLWRDLRELFDDNPPLVPYRDVKAPAPIVPELIALPSLARRMLWRGGLRKHSGTTLTRGAHVWDATPLRAARRGMGVPFFAVTSAVVVAEVFAQHPDVHELTAGLTAYFPFLKARNRYGVMTVRLRRDDAPGLARQIVRQTRRPIVGWGTSSAQTWALSQLPDRAYLRVVNYYRRQIDVLVSNLPVGELEPSVDGVPVVLGCWPRELTLPYYALLMGTRERVHVSTTSRATSDPAFASDDHVAAHVDGALVPAKRSRWLEHVLDPRRAFGRRRA